MFIITPVFRLLWRLCYERKGFTHNEWHSSISFHVLWSFLFGSLWRQSSSVVSVYFQVSNASCVCAYCCEEENQKQYEGKVNKSFRSLISFNEIQTAICIMLWAKGEWNEKNLKLCSLPRHWKLFRKSSYDLWKWNKNKNRSRRGDVWNILCCGWKFTSNEHFLD